MRYQGYTAALRTHGLEPNPELVIAGEFTFASGVAAAHRLLSGRKRPTAVFAANDDMALGVLAAAHRLGLSVPGELSIAGFDDSPAASLVWPPLTTVKQPMDAMARLAVALLVEGAGPADAVEDAQAPDTSPHRVLPHELIVRASTSAPGRG